jgi:hypothetical protein
MADEARVNKAAYVDAVFDIHLNLGFSGKERFWEKGYIIAENRHPEYGLTGIGCIDPEGTFNLTWLQITRLEGTVLYSGCPIDFGTLAIHEDSFMDVFTCVCLKGCSEDHECEISNLLENLIVFSTPQAILDNIRGTDFCEVGYRGAADLHEAGLYPEQACFATKRVARIQPVQVPQQRNLEDFFQSVMASEYDYDEPLGMGALLCGIDNKKLRIFRN